MYMYISSATWEVREKREKTRACLCSTTWEKNYTPLHGSLMMNIIMKRFPSIPGTYHSLGKRQENVCMLCPRETYLSTPHSQARGLGSLEGAELLV